MGILGKNSTRHLKSFTFYNEIRDKYKDLRLKPYEFVAVKKNCNAKKTSWINLVWYILFCRKSYLEGPETFVFTLWDVEHQYTVCNG